MGKGDNRRTKKVKQRKARRKLKLRGKKFAVTVKTARKAGKKGVTATTAAIASRAANSKRPATSAT